VQKTDETTQRKNTKITGGEHFFLEISQCTKGWMEREGVGKQTKTINKRRMVTIERGKRGWLCFGGVEVDWDWDWAAKMGWLPKENVGLG
jgi:hypothetical protein